MVPARILARSARSTPARSKEGLCFTFENHLQKNEEMLNWRHGILLQGGLPRLLRIEYYENCCARSNPFPQVHLHCFLGAGDRLYCGSLRPQRARTIAR